MPTPVPATSSAPALSPGQMSGSEQSGQSPDSCPEEASAEKTRVNPECEGDRALARRAQAGDVEARARVLEIFYREARHHSRGKPDPEDRVQALVTYLWERLPAYQQTDRVGLRTWASRYARYRWGSVLRGSGDGGCLQLALGHCADSDEIPSLEEFAPVRRALWEFAAAEPGPEDSAGCAEVRAAVEELPPGQRAAVVGRFWGDLTQVEVAERAGLSERQIRRNEGAALATLREVLR